MTAFDEELLRLSAAISEMGGLAEDQLVNALEAVRRRDPALAERIVDADRRIDAAEHSVEEFVIRTLTLRQPMAMDLREVIAALKVSSALERVGDLAKNIARRSTVLAQYEPTRLSGPVLRMGRQTVGQLSDVLDAYANRDIDKANAVWRSDVELDEIYNSLFRELLTYMMEDARTIGLCTQFMFIAKNLERIGDHATFIAEMVHYIVLGESPPEERPKGAPDGLGLTLSAPIDGTR